MSGETTKVLSDERAYSLAMAPIRWTKVFDLMDASLPFQTLDGLAYLPTGELLDHAT